MKTKTFIKFVSPRKPLREWPLGVYQIQNYVEGRVSIFRLLPNQHFQAFSDMSLQWLPPFRYADVAKVDNPYRYLGNL